MSKKKYEFKAINLIAETFEKHEAKFLVFNEKGHEELIASYSLRCGPHVLMRFISRDNDNDVAARIYGLIAKTPVDKRSRLMEACNLLNRKIRYMKCYVDTDGDINMEYDFPVHSSDDCIGEMVFEIFCRTMHILDREFSIFMKAIYTQDDLEVQESNQSDELRELIEELRADPDLPSGLRHFLDELEENEADENDDEDKTPESASSDEEVSSDSKEESFLSFLKTVSDTTNE